MKKTGRRALNRFAAIFGFLAVGYMAWFYVFLWFGDAVRFYLTRPLPTPITRSYINYVLQDTEGFARGDAAKADTLGVLIFAENQDRPYDYNLDLLIPYAGDDMFIRYQDQAYEQPMQPLARRLIFEQKTPALIEAVLKFHSSNAASVRSICFRFSTDDLKIPGYQAVKTKYCPRDPWDPPLPIVY